MADIEIYLNTDLSTNDINHIELIAEHSSTHKPLGYHLLRNYGNSAEPLVHFQELPDDSFVLVYLRIFFNDSHRIPIVQIVSVQTNRPVCSGWWIWESCSQETMEFRFRV